MSIELKQVTKKYGKEYALDHVSLSLTPGKIYGLLGPNGSGKSTFLKIISGLVFPDRGEILVEDQAVSRRISERVAYLTELDMFYEPFKVNDMLSFYQSQFQDFDRQKANELLNLMKLDGNKKIKKLSKGNRGRLKLVLAISRDAPFLLLDEPFSGLDPMVRESIAKILISHIDLEKQTVLIATHEIDEIELLLDEVIVIANGKIAARENVERVREEEGLCVKDWLKEIFQNKGE
ncbi:ABC transporter ATP-binding protein [Bacillus gobiensis]|uniref:ABC transporter ATP-binding protein n=1 Tax=Bacillus gobiensis TaxID=1441095 RepID=UPI003D1ACE3E